MNPFVVGKGNEDACLSEIVELSEKALAKYPTSIEADIELLKDPNAPRRKRKAIQVRLEEKLILKATIEKIQANNKDEL